MGLLGRVSREPSISIREWLAYVATNPSLVPPPDRVIDNPIAKGLKATIRGLEGEVNIMVAGRWVGTIVPGEEYDLPGTLTVYAGSKESAVVREFVGDVVATLQASVEWHEDSI
jgi:hypothetical protein